MALDHALRDLAEQDGSTVIRLYRWSTSTVSFGANESATRHWNRGALEHAGVPVVRRPSGGRAVWHDQDDLTYAYTGPLATFGAQQSAYHAIHECLAAALTRVGLDATLAPAPARLPGLRRGACFDVAVGGEVVVGEIKVIGSAQVVTRRALLQHGAIARATRPARLDRFRIDASPDEHAAAAVPVMPILPSAEDVSAAIVQEWLDRGARMVDPELTARANLASVQHLARYRDPLWTWRR
ncbi:MAG: hypothetical protein ABIZ70_00470 [Gemmatimonadales bacterium]